MHEPEPIPELSRSVMHCNWWAWPLQWFFCLKVWAVRTSLLLPLFHYASEGSFYAMFVLCFSAQLIRVYVPGSGGKESCWAGGEDYARPRRLVAVDQYASKTRDSTHVHVLLQHASTLKTHTHTRCMYTYIYIYMRLTHVCNNTTHVSVHILS